MKFTRTIFAMLMATALLAPLSGCGEQRSESEILQSAYADYQAGKYRPAFIELKNLLQSNPSSKDARLLLGMTSLKMGDAPSAVKELERARDLGASRDEYYLWYLQARVATGQHEEIIEEFDLTGMENEESRQIAKVFYGNALFGDTQVSAAEGEFRTVINSATANEPLRRAYLGLATVERSRGNAKAAIEMATKSIEYDQGSTESGVALGQLLLADEQYTAAQEQFVRVRQLPGVSSDERFVVAGGEVEAALNLQDIEEAKRAGNRLFELAPDHPVTGYLLARVAFTAGDKGAAYDYLQTVLSKYPQFRPAQTLQGALSLERKEYEQAEMFLSSVLAAQPGNLEARKLLAETRLQMDKPEEAAATLREALDAGVGDQQVVSMLGRASMQQGDRSAAIAQLERSLENNPDNPDLQVALAAAYLTNNQTARAIEVLNSGSGGADDKRRAMLLLLAAVQEKDNNAARKQAQAIAKKWPDDAQINKLVGGWYFSQGEYERARPYFSSILNNSPNDINALTNLGKIDLRQKKYADARNRYLQFLERDPTNEAGLLSLAYVYQAEGDGDSAMKAVEQAHNNDPSSEIPTVILSRYYLLQRDYEKSVEYASLASSANPKSVIAHMAKGTALMRLGKAEEALSSFMAADRLQPGNKRIMHAKAQSELQQQLFAQARETYQEIWQQDNGDYQAARNLAVLEIRAGRGAKAVEILKTLKASGKDPAVVVEIEGDIHRENKDIVKALTAYRNAYDLLPSRSVALKMHRVMVGGNGDPAAPLQKWLEQATDDFGVRVLLAQHHQKLNQKNQAIDQYRKVLELRPDMPLVLNNLAWLYFEQSDTNSRREALDMAKRAWELEPGFPQITDTYGWILFRSGQVEEGMKILAEAEAEAIRRNSPAVNDITYHYAVALNETGDRNAARSRLQRILGSNAEFTYREEATVLMDSLQR